MNKYSPSTRGVYAVSMLEKYKESGRLPADLIDITDDEKREACSGKLLTIGEGGVRVWAFPAPKLNQVVAAKMAELTAAYVAEITGDIEYPTGSGKVYQGDQRSLDALLSRLRIGTDPSYWRAKDNSDTSPFALSDVEALAGKIELRAAAAVETLHSRKDAVLGIVAQVEAEKAEAGTGIAEADGVVGVQAVVWSDSV